ncbi:MAG: hypothetical protein ABIP75_10805 [Pyrinomonadaceae bacterium]
MIQKSDSPIGRSIREQFDFETVDKLKQYVRLLGGDKLVTRKADIISLISAHLEGERLRELWNRLDSTQQNAVAETIYSPTLTFDLTCFVAKYDERPDFGRYDYYSKNNAGPTLFSLLFDSRAGIASELADRLRAFVPEPPPAQIQILAEPALLRPDPEGDGEERGQPVLRETERAALRDLKLILLMMREGKLRVGDKTGLPGAASTTAIGGALTGGDFYPADHPDPMIGGAAAKVGPIKSFAWPLLLQAAKLAVNAGSQLKLTPAGEKAIMADAAETIGAVWRRWLHSTDFDEFRRIDEIKGQKGSGRSGLVSVITRREAINAALRECPVGEWIDVDEFFRYMQAAKHDFEVTRDPWSLYVADRHYGSLGHHGFDAWEIIEGRYVLCYLFEYAATLGIVDVVYESPVGMRKDYWDLWGVDDFDFLSRYDGLREFRLTPLGAYCLGISPAYDPPPVAATATFSVLPSLRIVVKGEASVDELALLELIAVPISATEWSLDLVRLLHAIASGHESQGFAEFLQTRDVQTLPDTVSKFFLDAVSRAAAVKDRGPARLIECADATLADTIAAADATKASCVRAGERHLAVTAKHEPNFRKGLEKLGYILSA